MSSRAYDEAKGIDSSGDLDRRARPRDVGGVAGHKLAKQGGPPWPTNASRCFTSATGVRRIRMRQRRARHPVVIVGAGPVGLSAGDRSRRSAACRSVLLDDADRIGEGSRGICYSKRTLEILDRLGVGEKLVAAGRDLEARQGLSRRRTGLFASTCCRRTATRCRPSSICSSIIWKRRWSIACWNCRRSICAGATASPASSSATTASRLTIETPDGPYRLDADWVIAADGARSTMRDLLGLDFKGVTFEDKFLIADRAHAGGRFPDRAALLVRSAIPFRPVGADAPAAGRCLAHRPAAWTRCRYRARAEAGTSYTPRIRKMLGDRDFHVDWVSIYRFNCRRLDRFVHGRVIFVGDAAHQVSPFGARGANSGVQDAENLAWKLAAVLRGEARRSADRELRTRTHAGRRREYRPFDPLDRLHRAAFAGRADACAMPCFRSRRMRTSRGAWSIPDGCRSPAFTTRRYRRPMRKALAARRNSARRRRCADDARRTIRTVISSRSCPTASSCFMSPDGAHPTAAGRYQAHGDRPRSDRHAR